MASPTMPAKRAADMTPAERLAAREGLGLAREYFAGQCIVQAQTIRDWEFGVEPRNRLAFKCYVETLQTAMDEAARSVRAQ